LILFRYDEQQKKTTIYHLKVELFSLKLGVS
jgi:hypothetical protein